MDDPLADVVDAEVGNAKTPDVIRQNVDLLDRERVRPHLVAVARRHVVVRRGHGEIGPPYRTPLHP
ncbi:hypothetical protein D3C83_128290 [compost metagenome]